MVAQYFQMQSLQEAIITLLAIPSIVQATAAAMAITIQVTTATTATIMQEFVDDTTKLPASQR